MKILYVVSLFPKLSETFIVNQITTFIDNGDDIVILAENKSNEKAVHQLVTNYNLIDRTIYYNFPSAKVSKLLNAMLYSLAIFFKRPKLLFSLFNFNKYGKDSRSLRHIYAAHTLLGRKDYYDAVICHFGPNGNLAAILKDTGCLNGKLVTIFHGYDMTSHINAKGRDIYRFLFSIGDLFLPISNYWRDRLITLGCNPAKIKTHRMGVDVSKFKFSYRSIDKATIRLVSVARLIEKKGIEYVLKAVQLLTGKGLNINYTIIGEGPLKASLEQMGQSLGLHEQVNFAGSHSQEKVIEAIYAADAFVLPSVTAADGDMEGIPVVLMESMAMGKATVSTYHSGIGELIQNDQTGFLVKERDVSELADRLAEIINKDDSQLHQICNNARAEVEANFEIKKLNTDLSTIIKELTNG